MAEAPEEVERKETLLKMHRSLKEALRCLADMNLSKVS